MKLFSIRSCLFWDVTLYNLLKSANILEEHISSIFRDRAKRKLNLKQAAGSRQQAELC
jgi:hypothetical protein